MALVRVVVDGAVEAAKLVPFVFALNAAPAHAQLPRAVPAAVAAPLTAVDGTTVLAPHATIEPLTTPAALTLTAHHLEVHVEGTQARVLQRLTWRNDGATPLPVRYTLPASAKIAQLGIDPATEELVDDEHACGGTEQGAQFLEAGEGDPLALQSGAVWLVPGDQIAVRLNRAGTVLTRHGRHRLVLPLTIERDASFTPQFSAEVTVHGELPVKTLASNTHGGVVSGIGEQFAFLSVPNGRVYEGQHFALEFEFGEVAADAVLTAGAPWLRWGGEGRAGLRAAHYATR